LLCYFINIKRKDMNKKLILPAEIKICATCSFWDGERRVDPEFAIVVVDEACRGECLVLNKYRQGVNDESKWRDDCLWEHLAPDAPDTLDAPGDKQISPG
jgi:hypothetical protein